VNSGSQKQLARSLAIGLLVGLAGGLVGIYFGQLFYGAVSPGTRGETTGLLDFLRQIVARTVGWAIWGLLIGTAQGIATGSSRRIWLGAIGGVLGGAAGGFVFDLLPVLSAGLMTGEALRLLGFVAIGAVTGFFSSLAQEMFKQAWVRVLVGRGEGREFQIAKAETVVGRDELADIPLFGDPQIARRHLVIRQVNGRYEAAAVVTPGAMPPHRPGQPARRTVPPVDVPPGVCPFCGQSRDASGTCACTVGAPSPVQAAEQTAAPGAGVPTQMMGTPGSWTLQVVAGPLAGRSLTLSEGQRVSAGRSPDVELALEGDSFASRRHAVFSVQGGYAVVEDLGSTNGTLVNGARVTRQTLSKGDTVVIGQTQIRVM